MKSTIFSFNRHANKNHRTLFDFAQIKGFCSAAHSKSNEAWCVCGGIYRFSMDQAYKLYTISMTLPDGGCMLDQGGKRNLISA